MISAEVLIKEFLIQNNPELEVYTRMRRIWSQPELKGYGPKWQQFKYQSWVDVPFIDTLERFFLEWEKTNSQKSPSAKKAKKNEIIPTEV